LLLLLGRLAATLAARLAAFATLAAGPLGRRSAAIPAARFAIPPPVLKLTLLLPGTILAAAARFSRAAPAALITPVVASALTVAVATLTARASGATIVAPALAIIASVARLLGLATEELGEEIADGRYQVQ